MRLQPSTNPPPVHVLHLVIREQQASSTNPAATLRPQNVQTPQVAQTNPQSHVPAPPPAPQPGQIPFPPNLFQPALPGMAAAQQMIQNQMNAMQQHMAMHNQHMANAHPAQAQAQAQAQAHLRGLMPFQGIHGAGLGMGQPGAQVRTLPGTPNVDTRPGTPSVVQPPNGMPHIVQTGMTTRIHETIGPNGERIRTVINTNLPFPSNQPPPPQSNPVERSVSTPGMSAQTSAPPTVPGANLVLPPIRSPAVPAFAPNPFARNIANPLGVQPLLQPQVPQPNPTVYLLSSSVGPQALLFAPGHGYFSTPNSTQPSNSEALRPTPIQESTQSHPAIPVQPQAQGAPANNDANPARAEIVLRPVQGQNQPPPAVRPQRREAEDLLTFFLQRGWLFMRLYMFIYVFSEAGTWRRTMLISIAVFVCLLPRQNPLTDAFNVVRRHFDNLIGPPQAPQRQQPVQQPGQNGNANAGPHPFGTPNNEAARRSQNMPTPEEHARRLLREHQNQNPSFVRGILRSVEQAVALFLASLIPGVGERHVRAREEARRIVQEEEERRRREAEAIDGQSVAPQQMNPQPESSTGSGAVTNHGSAESKSQDTLTSSSNPNELQHDVGTSTGIDPSPTAPSTSAANPADAEGVRRRADPGVTPSSG